MKNKLIALVLVCSMILSILPCAFAANFDNTTEGRKQNRKGFCNVDTEEEYLRQALVDVLDEAMAEFASPKFYYAGVWNEAKAAYKEGVAVIQNTEDVFDLLEMTFFGLGVGEEISHYYYNIYLLSNLNKTKVKTAADLQGLKLELKKNVVAGIKSDFNKADFSAFYWQKLVQMKDEAFADIDAAATFTDYVFAAYDWEDAFYYESFDPEYSEIWEYLEAKFLNKEDMEGFAGLLEDNIYDTLDKLEERGYDCDLEEIDELMDLMSDKLAAAEYAYEAYRAYRTALEEICDILKVEPEAERELALIGYKKRVINQINEMFIAYNESDYTETGWYDLCEIYQDAVQAVWNSVYKDETGKNFLSDVKKDMDEVKTFAEELKAAKTEAVEAFGEYLGNAKYDQTKVKKLVASGKKAVAAAKEIDAVYEIMDKYITALDKTVRMFKIVTVKSGKGAVTKTANVQYGNNFTVKIVPAAGYKIKAIVVDGKKVKLTNAYTFKKVTKAHSIKVVFGG